MKLRGLISFSIYLLATIAFTFIYLLISERSVQPFTYDENSADFVVFLQALGYAAKGVGEELSSWVRFVAYCALINLAFFIAFKFAIGLRVREMIVVFILTLSLSFLTYGLLYPILNWIFGEYHSVTFTILIVTFVMTRYAMLYSQQHTK